MPGIYLSKEDCERLAAMLDVHVRPVYFGAANGDFPELGEEQLEHCDRLADRFREAAGIEAAGLERRDP